MGGADGGAGVDGPFSVVGVDAVVGGKHIHIGVPQGVDGAHVLPVALETVSGHLFAGVQHGGDDVLAEVVGALLIGLVSDEVLPQLGPGEDVDPHGGQVALGVLGLLLELIDVVVLVHIHNSEAGSLLHGDLQHRDGAGGVGLLVAAEQLGVVHLVDVVAGQDEYIFRVIGLQEVDVLVDGVGRAFVPGALFSLPHVGGQDVDAAVGPVQVPGLAVADVGIQLQRPVLGEHPNRVDTGVDAVGQGKVDDAILSSKGDRGFCHVAGEGVETAALSAGQ